MRSAFFMQQKVVPFCLRETFFRPYPYRAGARGRRFRGHVFMPIRTKIDFEAVFQALPGIHVLLTTDFQIVQATAAYFETTNTRPEQVIGKGLFDVFPENPDTRRHGGEANIRKSFKRVVKTGQPHAMATQRYDIPKPDGAPGFQIKIWKLLNAPILEEGVTVGLMITLDDRTEDILGRREVELRESLAMDIGSLGTWELDPASGSAITSANFDRMYGFSDSDRPISNEKYADRIHPEDRAVIEKGFETFASIEDDTELNMEYRLIWPNGELRHIVSQGRAVKDFTNVPARFVGVVMDVTDIRRRERELEQTLIDRNRLVEDQKMLLKEVNHRIKNSLQIVSSILGLEARKLGEGPARDSLQSARDRVRAISSVHELLYRQQAEASVRSDDYLKNLCDELHQSIDGIDTELEIHVTADPVMLDSDLAISLAMLVNEIVTNAIKHAFIGRERGRVDVSFRVSEGRRATLSISDDGTGLAEKASTGLGTSLIDSLASQIGAALTRENTPPGYTVSMVFDMKA